VGRSGKANHRLIRKSVSYTLAEISELLGCHVNTVRTWVRSGLPLIDNSRPQLVHGQDLFEFLNERKTSRRQSCAPDQMFCFKCRHPRHLAPGTATIVNARRTTITVTGLCVHCGTRMNRAASTACEQNVRETFGISPAGHRHLMGQGSPLDNCDFEMEVHDGPI
jgi:hypothetical protein